MGRIRNLFKIIAPTTLMSRFMLLVLLPMFLLQLSSFYIFSQRYWDRMSRNNIDNLVREIAEIREKYRKCLAPECSRHKLLLNINLSNRIEVNITDNLSLEENMLEFKNYKKYIIFRPAKYLKSKLKDYNLPIVNFVNNTDNYRIFLKEGEDILEFNIGKSYLIISRISLMVFWNVLAFILIAIIAYFFVKNQVKSIKILKDFANDFSYLEKDNVYFKPTGADEIREVGFAFLNLVKKIKGLINSRTTMLAQISHDLRTPVTRMKLQTEFVDDKEMADFFRQDLDEMEKMINEYLSFAKGEIIGNRELVDITEFFDGIVFDYKRSGYKNIDISYKTDSEYIYIKSDLFKRCINNLINNSLRYRVSRIHLDVETSQKQLVVKVEDDGIGLTTDLLKKVRKPYYSSKKENIGLGLSIVQHIVDMHNGKVYFTKSKKLGGLCVILIIPIKNKKYATKND